MRKELYNEICNHLRKLYRLPDGSVCHHVEGTDVPEGAERIIKHIDLWNHNVEFIEQEENWARPAVFVEICPITWEQTTGGKTQRGSGLVKLHIVTDWQGSAADGSSDQDAALAVFDYSEKIQKAIGGLVGEKFHALHLAETHTNHDHEDIVESVEVYRLRGVRHI